MNFKKLCSLLLLFAISFSLLHDYAFIGLEDDHHSLAEYVNEHQGVASDTDEPVHQIHSQFHISDIYPTAFVFLKDIERERSFFTHNKIFLSQNHFSFFKPPIS